MVSGQALVLGIRPGQSGAWPICSSGTWETVAQVPGFTRGIDFVGPLAFIGLSQVRESAVFSGIPLVRAAQGAHLWGVGGAHRDRTDRGLSAL